MKRAIPNDYRLPNGNRHLTPDEIRRSIDDFEYFMSNFQQIINKGRETVPFKLNAFQEKLFSTLLPMVKKDTRLDRRHHVVVLKPRQVGASVGVVAFINYLCAFVDGMENLNILHVFPVGDTVTKFYKQKVVPIISGVHPSLYPTMEYDRLSSSLVTKYVSTKSARRNNYYEIVASSANSIRSATVNVVLEDECLTGDVEVLTDQGFKRFDSLDKTEKIAQYDCDNGGISFVTPLRYIDRPYNGDAYEWTIGDGPSFVSTARHSFVVGKNGSFWRSTGNKFKRVEAHSVNTTGNYVVPTWGVGISDHEPLTPIERLGIAVQADGSVYGTRKRKSKVSGNVGWSMCRIRLKRKSKQNRIEQLLDESGLKHTITVSNKEGYKTYSFDLPYKNPKLLRSFLSENCSYDRAREILHEVLHWDGYGLDRNTIHGKTYLPKSSYYSSVIKDNVDFVASIALQAGMHCDIGTQKNDRSSTYKDVHRLRMYSRRTQTYQSYRKKPINYDGRVYCVEVPSGCIVVKTGHRVWVCGNCSFYRHPERLDSAIMPALPPYGFSLVVYLSTFENQQSNYFHQKILTALKQPDDWTLIFIPWYLVYPERPVGLTMSEAMPKNEHDIEYAKDTIIPAMKKDGIPKERWADCIDWYFRQKRAVPNMKFEFPTTIDEVLDATKDQCVFDKESIERQKENIIDGMQMRLITDNFTKEIKAVSVDPNEESSPFRMFKEPVYGHKYKLIADPITSISGNSDTFAMIVMDDENLEQVAVFQSRDMPLEDYADYAVSIAKIYNNAIICPESNMAAAFTQAIYNIGYRYLYYEPKEMKKKLAYRTPGVRTTASSKEALIDVLKQLLITDKIILHDAETISELETFVKKTKEHRDGSVTVKMMAENGALDDLVACLWCYVATLSQKQLSGSTKQKWTII